MEPLDIYQEWLDRASAALWSGDWDGLAETMRLPAEMGAYDDVVAAETPADVRRYGETYLAVMREAGATAYLRLAREARLSDDGRTIDGVHEVHVLSGGTRVVPSFTSEVALELGEDGAWRGTSIISQARMTENRINVGKADDR
ncbi:hypothetical protein JQC91_11605 [Jannaschia sp. Os4]|uniref:hypothetical protein n=1 Tax=Jannaschia sp. Os4 TaxID=2807617 RepID=UPI00193A9F23|nr:hypothetical protein [Jannaschia sp. Os4]MBM2576944.1 hypothetical protein [Jannaschia sp. Os4]